MNSRKTLAATVTSVASTDSSGLPSGAGHDGMAMIALGPIGMLFVRCKAGISHSPLESVEAADVTVAARVLREFIDNFVQGKS